MARESADDWCLSEALRNAGRAYCVRHDLVAARGRFVDALAVAREAGDVAATQTGLLALGRVAILDGDWAGAGASLAEAVRLGRRLAGASEAPLAYGLQAELAEAQGDTVAARR